MRKNAIRGIRFYMEEDEAMALADYAYGELRTPQSQALLIVRQELIRLGYLDEQGRYIPRHLDDFRKTNA